MPKRPKLTRELAEQRNAGILCLPPRSGSAKIIMKEIRRYPREIPPPPQERPKRAFFLSEMGKLFILNQNEIGCEKSLFFKGGGGGRGRGCSVFSCKGLFFFREGCRFPRNFVLGYGSFPWPKK